MIRGIHYFSAELKTNIDIIPRGCFKHRRDMTVFYLHESTSVIMEKYDSRRQPLSPL